MSVVPSQISQALGFSAMTVLVVMFSWLYARDPQRQTRRWLVGWIAIELHFAGNLLRYAGWIPSNVADWLAYATLLFAAANFFLSVCQNHLTERTRLVFWGFVFSPAVLYATLLVSGATAKWPYGCILGVAFVASTGIFVARVNPSVASILLCVLAVALPGMAVMVGNQAPAHGIELLLFDAFAATSVGWLLKFRRPTPGAILTSISFAAWGCVWPASEVASMFGGGIPDYSVIWDLPKYFVAFGMIMTLLEEQTEALRVEIRERRGAESALRESAFFLEESQRISQFGSFTFNLSTGSGVVSPAAHQIFGTDPAISLSLGPFLELLRSGGGEDLTPDFSDLATPAGKRFDRELIITRRTDGAERFIHWRAAVVDQGLHGKAISGTVQDVTESKIVEQDLIQAKKMESVGRLAGGVAHDFNNLLTIINGYSELILTRSTPAEPVRGFVEEIRNAGVRAAELTHQLLAFSRRQALQPVDLDLNAITVETGRLLAHLIPKNIAVVSVLEPGLLKTKADPGQLTQVLLNLVVNARDAMPNGGRVTIETANVARLPPSSSLFREENDLNFVRISVTDTGSGMDEDTQNQLFEPFFTTKPRGSGTGLGLSTVYGIVKQSGGYINVQTELGTGTRFDIYLPASPQAPLGDGVELSPQPEIETELGGKTILVVEDQRAARKLVLTILQGSGYRTIEAANGEEALALVRERKCSVDLLLSDVVMPGISGRMLAERLRNLRPGTPAILMSGYTGDVLDQSISDGDFGFLQKPFSPQRLLEMVEESLQLV